MPLSQSQLDFFKLNGYLHIPGLVPLNELEAVQRRTRDLIDKGIDQQIADASYKYGLDAQDKSRKCLFRIDNLLTEHDSDGSFRLLLAYPPLLGAISQAVDGDYFVSSVHSTVFKIPHRGYPVSWHQDPVHVHRFPVFNVDVYLDEAHPGNGGLWVIPGSHLGGYHGNESGFVKSWTEGKEENAPGAIPVITKPGDVIFHATTVLHGSFWNRSDSLRRTIYFHIDHFRDIVIKPPGQWPQNIYLRSQELMQEAIALRKKTYPTEEAFPYRVLPPEMLPA
jgi:Phytanoyl-CoA dioxygenase (PhyH)